MSEAKSHHQPSRVDRAGRRRAWLLAALSVGCLTEVGCGGPQDSALALPEARPARERGEGETAAATDVVLILNLAGRVFALKEPWEDRRRPYPNGSRVLSTGSGVQWLVGRPRKSDVSEVSIISSPLGAALESCVAQVVREVTLVERCPVDRSWDSRRHGVHFPALELSGCSVPPDALLTGFPGRVRVEGVSPRPMDESDPKVRDAVELVESRIASERLGHRVTGVSSISELGLVEVLSHETSYLVRDGEVAAVLGDPLVLDSYLRVGDRSFFYVSNGIDHEGYLVVSPTGLKHRFARNVPRQDTCAGDERRRFHRHHRAGAYSVAR